MALFDYGHEQLPTNGKQARDARYRATAGLFGGATATATVPAEDPYKDQPASLRPLSRQIDAGLTQYGDTARGLQAQEEQRGAASEAYARDAEAAAKRPTITEADIRRQLSQVSDRASGQFLDDMSGMREYAGASGVTGGGQVAGQGTNAALGYLRTLTQARGDLMAFKATQDALDTQKQYDRAMNTAAAINRPVSMIGADYDKTAIETRLAQQGLFANYDASKYAADKAAKASKNASNKGLFGGLLGGALSLFGA